MSLRLLILWLVALAKEVFLVTVESQQGVEAEFVAIIDVFVSQDDQVKAEGLR